MCRKSPNVDQVIAKPSSGSEEFPLTPSTLGIFATMYKRFGWGLILIFGLVCCISSAQTFSVSFSKSLSAQPLDGRLLLLLSTDSSAEPRFQIDDTPKSQLLFGVNADGWAAGQAIIVDTSANGYPIRSLK